MNVPFGGSKIWFFINSDELTRKEIRSYLVAAGWLVFITCFKLCVSQLELEIRIQCITLSTSVKLNCRLLLQVDFLKIFWVFVIRLLKVNMFHDSFYCYLFFMFLDSLYCYLFLMWCKNIELLNRWLTVPVWEMLLVVGKTYFGKVNIRSFLRKLYENIVSSTCKH